MKLPTLTIEVHDEDRPILAEFNTKTYLTTDAATLRAKGQYFLSMLFAHVAVLDKLVEKGAETTASTIRAEEKLNTR